MRCGARGLRLARWGPAPRALRAAGGLGGQAARPSALLGVCCSDSDSDSDRLAPRWVTGHAPCLWIQDANLQSAQAMLSGRQRAGGQPLLVIPQCSPISRSSFLSGTRSSYLETLRTGDRNLCKNVKSKTGRGPALSPLTVDGKDSG